MSQAFNQIKKCGIIGAGQMGGASPMSARWRAMMWFCQDISKIRSKGLATISGNMTRQVARGIITEAERKPALARINFASTVREHGRLRPGDRVGHRRRNRQAQDLPQLCPHLKSRGHPRHQHLVDLDHPAGLATDRPEKFIGIHFMNPVPVMELVELVRGIATDDETYEASRGFVAARQDRSPWPRISRPSSSTASCCR
jgi:3-hydroxybutyryl-CoA dehydrogenase